MARNTENVTNEKCTLTWNKARKLTNEENEKLKL
ncbi:hypothetical protein T09_6982 [Trichinella sp. T9]|nr:hypothetical protein T09_6982 [Trichinella sp. T9]